MNVNEFLEVESTVITTKQMNDGTELWVRYEDGREHAYMVRNHNFLAREGHEITEIQYRGRVVALRNNNTKMSFRLLDGTAFLGIGPQVTPKPRGFWFTYFAFALPVILLGNAMVEDSASYWQHHWIEHWIANIYCFITSVGGLVILPLRFVFWQDIKKFRHGRKVKAASALIFQMYDKL